MHLAICTQSRVLVTIKLIASAFRMSTSVGGIDEVLQAQTAVHSYGLCCNSLVVDLPTSDTNTAI